MKPNGLLIAVGLLAVLGGLVWWSNRSQASATKNADSASKILSIPEDQFQEIRIKKVTGETIALNRADGKWRITQPKQLPADQDAVSTMVTSLASLSSSKVVEEKSADLQPYGLHVPTLNVEIQKKDGKTESVLVGDDTPTGSDAYAKLPGADKIYTIASYTKSSLDKRVDDLRDKRLMPFEQDKLTRLELQAKGQTVEFGKNSAGEWQIVKPRPLRADSSAVNSLVDKLHDTKMDATATEEDPAKGFAAGTRVAVATVTDAGGTQTIEIRRDKDKNVFAKSSAVAGMYKVGSDVADGVDKGLDDFRNKKLFDFGFSDPTKVDLKNVSYTKNGDKWTANGKNMDNATVQSLIDKLRDLAATKFADTAAGDSVFEATVTSNSGKRLEKVVIRKQGTRYFAQREGEPSIYELEAKSVEDLEKSAADVKEAAPEPAKK